jgi:poly-gamma-glutamate synthesis protein (capsule biosynthesis protein)
MDRPVTVAMTGDVMLGRGVDEALKQFGPTHPWGDVRPLLNQADLAIVNLECVVGSRGQPWTRSPKTYHFRADPIAIESLKCAGIDCVTLANNHVLDYEEEALLEMLALLEQAGIASTGAGRNLAESRRPALVDARGLRVGVIAFTDNEPGWAAKPSALGTNYVPILLDEWAMGPIRQSIDRARSEGADLVVFTIHWGPNLIERPSPLFREFAHAVIDAGADLVFGHSAHVFQGIELYKGCPIIYDAGDFVDDYVVHAHLRNDWGLLFRLEVDGAKLQRIELIPTLIRNRQVNCASNHEFEAIAARIEALSAEFGTTIEHEGKRLWIRVGTPR